MSIFKESNSSGKLLTQERKRILFFGLPLTFTKYFLTEKKLVVYQGLFTTTEDEILLYRIQDISRKRNLLQKLFGLGTVVVSSQDRTTPVLEIKNIQNSDEFKDMLSEQIEKEKARMKVRAGEYVGSIGHQHCDELGHDPDELLDDF